ncbi:MAG: DUF4424 domain-containing protein [Candidatus Aegiribacteria sp.]|nr:DUF4424 domain-containing protein [Candidatus Aegiribacteria sp.]
MTGKYITLVLLTLSLPLAADSAVIFRFPDGRSAVLTTSDDIAMTAESVSIVPSGGMYDPWEDGFGWLPWMKVRCVFELMNLTDEPLDVTVGFPIDAKFGDAYTVFSDSMLVDMFDSTRSGEGRDRWFRTGFSTGEDAADQVPDEMEFTASVGEVQLEVSYRTCLHDLEQDLVWKPILAVWEMHFDPGETVKLVNTYNTSWDYSGFMSDANYSINYIVTSGATWAGNIGSAVITLEVPEELPLPMLSDTLSASWEWTGSPVINGRTVTWEYNDWEPEENLAFRVHTVEDGGFEWETVSVEAMDNALVWTQDELLSSVSSFLADEFRWTPPVHAELLLHMAEAVPYLVNRMSPPDPTILRYFNGYDIVHYAVEMQPEDLEKLEVVRDVEQMLRSDMTLVEEAGYTMFLPIFRLRWRWDEDRSDMWSAYPEAHEAYVKLVEARDAIERGVSPGEPALEAFFRLTATGL